MRFHEHVVERAISVGQHIVATEDTYRETARKFSVCKSTVHVDVAIRLPLINPGLAEKVRAIALAHLAQRHIRGGEATRAKYQQRRQHDAISRTIRNHR